MTHENKENLSTPLLEGNGPSEANRPVSRRGLALFGSVVACIGVIALLGLSPSTATGLSSLSQLRGGSWIDLTWLGAWDEILKVEGDGNYQEMGKAVSIDAKGKKVLIGCPGANNKYGEFHLWDVKKDKELIVVKGTQFGQLGYSASIAGESSKNDNGLWMAVGAPFHQVSGQAAAGAVRLFRVDGTTVHEGGDIFGHEKNENFGWDVAMSGNGRRLVMGAPCFSSRTQVGYVKTYRRDTGADDWYQWTTGLISSFTKKDMFGSAVAMAYKGDNILIGAYKGDAAYLYQVENQKWDLKKKFEAPVSNVGFGYAVGISEFGDKVAIGSLTGAKIYTYFFKKGNWNSIGSKPINPKLACTTITLSFDRKGRNLLIGCPSTGNGEVYSYNYDKGWKYRSPYTKGDATGSNYGTSVSLQANAQEKKNKAIYAVGSNMASTNQRTKNGAAYVQQYNNNDDDEDDDALGAIESFDDIFVDDDFSPLPDDDDEGVRVDFGSPSDI